MVKDLSRYEEIYDITSNGEIFNKQTGKKLKPCEDRNGYQRIHLTKNKQHKMHYVHRLVAETFIENPENKPYVNHIDGNPRNNRVSNLEWCTAKENTSHAMENGLLATGMNTANGKFTDEQVEFIRECYAAGYSYRKLGRIFMTEHYAIMNIINGSSYKNVKQKKSERYSPLITSIVKKMLEKYSWQEVAEMTGLDRERVRNIWGTPRRSRSQK